MVKIMMMVEAMVMIKCSDLEKKKEKNKKAQGKGIFVGTKFRPVPRAHEQAGRVRLMELEIRLALAQGWSI